MVHFDTTDRSRLAEDEYFRRQDAEILHRARERAALAEALGAPTPMPATSYTHAACGLRPPPDRVRAPVRDHRMADRPALRTTKTEAAVRLPAYRHPPGLRTPAWAAGDRLEV